MKIIPTIEQFEEDLSIPRAYKLDAFVKCIGSRISLNPGNLKNIIQNLQGEKEIERDRQRKRGREKDRQIKEERKREKNDFQLKI